MDGDTLFEMFAEVEFGKHFSLALPKDVPVSVEYVAGQPEIAAELRDAWRAFQAMPEDVRPKAIAWDHDNNRPLNVSESPLITR
jgi:hypothetical protein